jgi:hypothetical protein
LNRKGIVDRKTLKDMSEMLAGREVAHKAVDESSDDTVSGDDDDEEHAERQKRRRFSDTLIQQRMEEDRERVPHLPKYFILLMTDFSSSISDLERTSGRSRRLNLMPKIQSLRKPGKRPAI